MISTRNIWYWHDGKLSRTKVRWEFKGVSRSPQSTCYPNRRPVCKSPWHHGQLVWLHALRTTIGYHEKRILSSVKNHLCATHASRTKLSHQTVQQLALLIQFWICTNIQLPNHTDGKTPRAKAHAQQFPVSLFFVANFTLFVKRSLFLWTKTSSTVSFL